MEYPSHIAWATQNHMTRIFSKFEIFTISRKNSVYANATEIIMQNILNICFVRLSLLTKARGIPKYMKFKFIHQYHLVLFASFLAALPPSASSSHFFSRSVGDWRTLIKALTLKKSHHHFFLDFKEF